MGVLLGLGVCCSAVLSHMLSISSLSHKDLWFPFGVTPETHVAPYKVP